MHGFQLFTSNQTISIIYCIKNNASLFHLELRMGFLTILKKLRQKEKEMRILMLYPFICLLYFRERTNMTHFHFILTFCILKCKRF